MNITKLILLACPILLASILLVANPAHASNLKSAYTIHVNTLVSTQQIFDLATPRLTEKSNPITDQLGCNCAECVQAEFHLLQGKLPSVSL
jgi:hypothetical protein